MNRSTPMKRTGFRRPERKPLPPPVVRPLVRPPVYAAAPTVAVPKEVVHRDATWARVVARLTCVRCGIGQSWDHEAQSQAAHRNEGKGAGQKVDDCLQAALCPPCHAEIDQGKDMTRAERRAEVDRCLVLTFRELVRRGCLKLTGVLP